MKYMLLIHHNEERWGKLSDAERIPWTEIDFPDDLARAEREVAPILAAPAWSHVAA